MSSPRLEQSAILSLDRLARADRAQIGSKAANLGELRRAGFAVPDGLVVTGIGEVDTQAITAALGDAALAVRSSAAAEDLADASFAGQYESRYRLWRINSSGCIPSAAAICLTAT